MTSPPSSAAAPAPDWSSLVDHWGDISAAWFKALSERAKENSEKFQEGSYDRDAWVGDVAWFFTSLADNTAAAAKACNDLFPQQ